MTTLAMIEEFVTDCEIIGKAPHANNRFSHAAWIDDGQPAPEVGLLPCGEPKSAAAFLREHPKSFCVCIAPTANRPPEITPFAERALVLHSERGALFAFDRVQALLSRFSTWKDAMKTTLLEGRSYQSLLTLSEPILQNFISISNSQFRLIAYTKGIRTDDPVIASLVENGFHTKETIDLFKRLHTTKDWESQRRITLKPVSDVNVNPVFDFVFRMHGEYFLHVNMHCNARKPSAGLADAFQDLIDCLEYCVKQDWTNRFSLEQEPSILFRDLIERKAMGKRALAERLKAIGIARTGSFSLLAFRLIGGSDTRTFLPYCVARIKDLFPTCFVGSYNNHALLLDPADSALANDAEQLKLFTEAHFCAVGISEPFSDIADFPYAYHQATRAIELGSSPDCSIAASLDRKPGHSLYRFRDHFAAFVADTAYSSSHLVKHCAETSLVKRIAQADARKGTDDLRILYVYLKNERKASLACAELFLHRNTLLYRIAKLEREHGFSLDDASTRLRIMAELFLCRG